ncbi:MAG: leucine-rich repeat domain-containing protein, partial [Alphaproteobacteria bacterium]|nr:leucine-rich repeat domain-containing protein [Alphaproteobacteria bacterium]
MQDPFPRIAAMLAAEDEFDALVRLGDLDPATDFIGADLRHVRFGPSLDGADLSGADLRGTNIGEVAPGYFISAATRLPTGATLRRPADFDEDKVPAMLVAGEALPRTWLPFIKKINLDDKTEFFRLASLAGCFNLERLDADRTKVTDLSALQGLTQLRELDLSGTSVSDLSALQGL